MKDKGNVAFAIFFLLIFLVLIIGYTTFTSFYSGMFPDLKTMINETSYEVDESSVIIKTMENAWAFFPYVLLFAFIVLFLASSQKREAQTVYVGG